LFSVCLRFLVYRSKKKKSETVTYLLRYTVENLLLSIVMIVLINKKLDVANKGKQIALMDNFFNQLVIFKENQQCLLRTWNSILFHHKSNLDLNSINCKPNFWLQSFFIRTIL